MEYPLMNSEEYYKDLVIKIISGSATQKEIIKQWIDQGSENEAYYSHMRMAWVLAFTSNTTACFVVNRAWEKSKPAIKNVGKKRLRQGFFVLSRIAAITVLSFFLGGGAIYLYTSKSSKIDSKVRLENKIEVPLGSKSKAYLPDGSIACVNAGSKLSYSQTYNTEERIVLLEGEAYFKVKTNPKKPFIAKTSEMNVMAYGTAFNVKAYPNEPNITTTLEEGIVKVKGSLESKKFEVSLKPNHPLSYTKKENSTNNINSTPANTINKKRVPKNNAASQEKAVAPVIISKINAPLPFYAVTIPKHPPSSTLKINLNHNNIIH